MKKICFIAQFPPPIHGLSKAVDTLYSSELADEFEFEKINITDNKKFFENIIKIRKSNADLFYFTISQSKKGNLRDLLIFKAINNRPCLVHLHGGYYRKLIDNDLPNWQRKKNYKAINNVTGAIVLGPSLRYNFEGMLPNERIFVAPNCVDNKFLISDQEFNEKIINIDKRAVKHVLYLSNFIRSKGYVEVLELAKFEKQRIDAGGAKKFHFDFAGKFFDKKEKEFFSNYIERNHLEEYVTYHGVVDGENKRKLLKECDVFCLLTTYPKEGQPISILEAMGNGMVVISTNYAGIPDIASNGRNGIIVDPRNIDTRAIYQSLLTIKFRNIEINNRDSIINNYKEEKYIMNMRKIYRKALKLRV